MVQMPDPMLPQLYRVCHVLRETLDTVTLELEPADGGDVPPFAPGQFNMLYVFGMGEIPISISGDSADRKMLVHTVRDVGLVSGAVCACKPGDTIGVRGPFGSCWPVEQAVGKDVVVVAGGLGLAPLRSALYHVLAQRKKYKRIVLFYSAHMPENLLYRRELEQWRARFDLDVDVIVGHATSEWRGDVGYVTTFIPRARLDPTNVKVMICGPEVLMRFSAREFENRGVAADDIFIAMERNMKCAYGMCGHCQIGPYFACKDGSIFQYSGIRDLLVKAEL